MKYILTLIAGYLLPSISQHVSLDVCLGIAAGVLFGLLVAMLFVGPTPRKPERAITPRVKTQRRPRKIIEQTAPQGWTFTPVNYPQGACA